MEKAPVVVTIWVVFCGRVLLCTYMGRCERMESLLSLCFLFFIYYLLERVCYYWSVVIFVVTMFSFFYYRLERLCYYWSVVILLYCYFGSRCVSVSVLVRVVVQLSSSGVTMAFYLYILFLRSEWGEKTKKKGNFSLSQIRRGSLSEGIASANLNILQPSSVVLHDPRVSCVRACHCTAKTPSLAWPSEGSRTPMSNQDMGRGAAITVIADGGRPRPVYGGLSMGCSDRKKEKKIESAFLRSRRNINVADTWCENSGPQVLVAGYRCRGTGVQDECRIQETFMDCRDTG